MITSRDRWARGLLVVLVLLASVCGLAVAASAPYMSYTYDYHGRKVPSPTAYLPADVVRGDRLGVGDFRDPSDFFVTHDNHLYVLDTGNNRIVCIDEQLNVIGVIDELSNSGIPDRFSRPRGLFVTPEGTIFVADTENTRVLALDRHGKVLQEIRKPESPEEGIVPDGFVFRPIQVAVSPLGRIYVLGANVFDGIMVFDLDGVFGGFIGAPRVAPSAADVLWSRIATREQRSRQALFLPANYRTMDVDERGFIFATERNVIKRLNPAGLNVLIEQGFFSPQGDLVGLDEALSDFVDILSREGGVYSVLDRTRGRIFTYDHLGNLLYVFGGLGTSVGSFVGPAAIEEWQGHLLVLDQQTCEFTVFRPTEYAKLIHGAILAYQAGKTDLSVELWRNVLLRNANYDLAYSGIGRAFLLSDEYRQALDSFRNGSDRVGYSRAYSDYRKELVAQNLGVFLTILLALSAAVWMIAKGAGRRVIQGLRRRLERPRSQEKGTLSKIPQGLVQALRGVQYSLFVILHPFDGFDDLKHESIGGVTAATVLLLLETGSYVFMRQYSGFLFNQVDLSRFSVALEAAGLLIPFLLWCGVNWCLTTLFDGKGSLRDIYIASAYALVPLMIMLVPASILSNHLLIEEGFLYYLLLTSAVVWSATLLLVAMIVTHEYTFGKTVLTSILTLGGIGVVVFIAMLFFAVISQVTTFVSDIYTEVAFRL